MCLSQKHVEFLLRTNEVDLHKGTISFESYAKLLSVVERCADCDRCDNGQFGDILPECRVHFLRIFMSMKRHTEQLLAQRRARSRGLAWVPVGIPDEKKRS